MSCECLRNLPKTKTVSCIERQLLPREFCYSQRLARCLVLAPDMRLDVAVRLVDWHKNFIGIVLPKARKVHQQTMFIRHGQFDVRNLANIREHFFGHRVERVLYGFAFMRAEYLQVSLAN